MRRLSLLVAILLLSACVNRWLALECLSKSDICRGTVLGGFEAYKALARGGLLPQQADCVPETIDIDAVAYRWGKHMLEEKEPEDLHILEEPTGLLLALSGEENVRRCERPAVRRRYPPVHYAPGCLTGGPEFCESMIAAVLRTLQYIPALREKRCVPERKLTPEEVERLTVRFVQSLRDRPEMASIPARIAELWLDPDSCDLRKKLR